jgi:hypothetical protein
LEERGCSTAYEPMKACSVYVGLNLRLRQFLVNDSVPGPPLPDHLIRHGQKAQFNRLIWK